MRRQGVEWVALGRAEAGVEGVHASTEPQGAALVVLVAEGVGQRLDRRPTPDEVAVPVQPGVHLDQGQGSVPRQHLQRGAAQDGPADGDRSSWCRWERRGIDGGRSAPTLPGDRRPQAVAQLDQLLDRADPLLGEGRCGLVDLAHPSEQLVAPLVGPPPGQRRHAACHPVPEQVAAAEAGWAAEVRWPAVHELAAVEVDVGVAGVPALVVLGHRSPPVVGPGGGQRPRAGARRTSWRDHAGGV